MMATQALAQTAVPLTGTGRLLTVAILVAVNALFVAAEFSLVASRRTKVDELAAGGARSAKNVQAILNHMDRYLAATQLGITIASLAIGWIGVPALASLFDAAVGSVGWKAPNILTYSTAALTIAFAVLTFVHVVLGELVPKSFALAAPERTSSVIAAPLLLFSSVMRPFVWLFKAAAAGVLKSIGVEPTRRVEGYSPEEFRLLVMQAQARGTLDESDSAMLAGVLDFHAKKARDVMRPRTEIVALEIDATEAEVWALLREERYSRYPVYEETLDDVIGVFLAKDLWLHAGDTPFSLRDFVRQPLYVPDSRPAERVLDDLRKTRAHMAVVLDEYGGTAGILTMEDLIEEVVGDIADEYDFASRTSVETNGVLELAGSLSLIDVRSDHRVQIPEGDWTTLGGYAFAKLGRLPKMGDRIPIPGGEMEVVAMDGRRIAALRIHRAAPSQRATAAV
ncbi:MAG: hemolysin family protein [Gemmatimonadota bacterium]|nr:hemolysin family protein [Gemmatimonadota bacterium]